MSHQNDVKARVADAYERAQLAVPEKTRSLERYLTLLEHAQDLIRTTDARVFSTSFDGSNADMPIYGRARNWQWASLHHFLRARRALGVLVRLPLFWQVEPLIFNACKDAGGFPFVNDVANMPVGRLAVTEANVNTILTTVQGAQGFSRHLVERNTPFPPNWFVVHQLSDTPIQLPYLMRPGLIVHNEVHLFPGIPLFYQCAALAESRQLHFHVADGFIVDSSETQKEITVTGTPDDVLPLYHCKLPYQLADVPSSVCACKERIVSLIW